MPDYIYLLENRLSNDQRNALRHVSEAAREAGMTVFLVGGAVRDLISGASVRDLDVAVQGNALKLKKHLLKEGAKLWGEHEPSRTLYLRFPVGVSVEVSSARREEYPKPAKPVYHWDNILQDLRRRDFTANAMALSLNEHSYGLLMDPLNGVADIDARQLRLVSNYGFIDEPARLLRATRLATRLGWELDERTKARYENAKQENAIELLSSYQRGYELEEIAHEEDGLRALQAMEAEGWMRYLDPKWTAAKADSAALEQMHGLRAKLQMQGISPDISAASFQLLTAKLQPKDLTALKRMFIRPGFIEEWEELEGAAKDFAKRLSGKEAATPSATWKLFNSADPQAVLWLGLTSKAAAIQAKYTNFFTIWPEARQKVPYTLMQEMRITPEISGYQEMLNQLFFGVIDGKLETEEQLRAFLEPYSPPAPPPPVTIRRTRASKKSVEAKLKATDVEQADEAESGREIDGETETGELTRVEREPAATKKPGKLAAKEAPAKTEPAGTKRGSSPAHSPVKAPVKTVRQQASSPVTAKSAVAKSSGAGDKRKHQAASQSGGKSSSAKKAPAKTANRPAGKAAPKAALKSKAPAKNGSGKKTSAAKAKKSLPAAKKASSGKKSKPGKKR